MTSAQREATLFFAALIEKELGIVYAEFNLFQLEARLEEVCKLLGLDSVAALHAEAKTGLFGARKQVLLDVATNNETLFFRDRAVFDSLRGHILPQLLAASKEGIDIWSAACSTGQEALSVAMILHDLGALPRARILGTDISDRVLEKARSGCYSQLEVQRGLQAPQLVKFFTQVKDSFWRVDDSLRVKMRFEQQNLLSSFDHRGLFDLILCRNVLIYQPVKNKAAIVDRLRRRLKPGGYLVLGSGESLMGISQEFEAVRVGESVFYKDKAVAARVA